MYQLLKRQKEKNHLLKLLVFIVVGIAAAVAVEGAPLTSLKMCYLNWGFVSDLGYSFSFNIARLNVETALQQKYPAIPISSVAVQNVAYGLTDDQQTALVASFISSGCNIIVGADPLVFGSKWETFVVNFTNVSWVALMEFVGYVPRPNRIALLADPTAGYYIAGASAASIAKKCVAFVLSWLGLQGPPNAFAGFLAGVRSVNSTLPVHAISEESWASPQADTIIAQAFIGKGCEVIAHYSDPRQVDLEVLNANIPGLFSVGPHSNLQEYVGDTVLVATFPDYAPHFMQVAEDVLATGMLNQSRYVGGTLMSFFQATAISTAAPTSAAAAYATAASHILNTKEVVCGNWTLASGGTLPLKPNGCYDYTNPPPSLPVDGQVVVHPIFVDPATCPAGTYYNYSFAGTSGLFTLTCPPCPLNTFSDIAGAPSCSSCSAGTVATSIGSIRCVVPSTSVMTIVAIVIPTVIGCLTLLLAILLCQRHRRRTRRAPREPPLCLVFTDVETSTVLWQKNPTGMAVAMEVHNEAIRRVIDACGAYEVKTVGDSFMIAIKDIGDAVIVALEIQRALRDAGWPEDMISPYGDDMAKKPQTKKRRRRSQTDRGLRVRIGLHYCTDILPTYEPLQQYYDYYGNDVNLASRIEACAEGRQILVTEETRDLLLRNEKYASLGLSVELVKELVELKGVARLVNLYAIRAKEDDERDFLMEECDDVLSDEACNHSTTSSGPTNGSSGRQPSGLLFNHAAILSSTSIAICVTALLKQLPASQQSVVMKIFVAHLGIRERRAMASIHSFAKACGVATAAALAADEGDDVTPFPVSSTLPAPAVVAKATGGTTAVVPVTGGLRTSTGSDPLGDEV